MPSSGVIRVGKQSLEEEEEAVCVAGGGGGGSVCCRRRRRNAEAVRVADIHTYMYIGGGGMQRRLSDVGLVIGGTMVCLP